MHLKDLTGAELKIWLAARKCESSNSTYIDVKKLEFVTGLSKNCIYKTMKLLMHKGILERRIKMYGAKTDYKLVKTIDDLGLGLYMDGRGIQFDLEDETQKSTI